MRYAFVLGIPQLDSVKLGKQIVDLESFYLIVCFIAVHERFVPLEGIIFCNDFGELLESWKFGGSLVDDENIFAIEVVGVELVDHVFGFFFRLLFD